MNLLLCVGLNWKTPIALRERLAFNPAAAADALQTLKCLHPDNEFALLSTCNRTELYAVRHDQIIHHNQVNKSNQGSATNPTKHLTSSTAAVDFGSETLERFLADFHQIPLLDFHEHLYVQEGAGAALHLFRVASGLDSLVLGEVQILGQVRQAYLLAQDQRAVGGLLHSLFKRALIVGKRVQNETGLSQGRISVASVAIEHVKEVFSSFQDKTVLVVGAGKIAELTLKHLRHLQPGRILVCNRSADKAQALADQFHGSTRPFEQLHAALTEADIVISSTGAREPIIHYTPFLEVMRQRRHRHMVLLDLAVPRDIDPKIRDLDQVLLWNIDDLESVRHETMRAREKELDKALRIVDEELEQFRIDLAAQQSGATIRAWETALEQVTEKELDRLLARLKNLSDKQQEEIRQFAFRLRKKFMHTPLVNLRNEANQHQFSDLLLTFRKLFGLGMD